MKKKLTALLGLTLAAATHAVPVNVNFTDVINPEPDIKLTADSKPGSLNSYRFIHDILDDGFGPNTHIVLNADLYISLSDDQSNDPIEKVTIRLDGGILAQSVVVQNNTYQFNVDTELLQQDGKLAVKLSALTGDFYFRGSELTVQTQLVPEPSTFALAGIGLLGIAFMARRRKA